MARGTRGAPVDNGDTGAEREEVVEELRDDQPDTHTVSEAIKAKLADSIKWNTRYTLKENNFRPWEINAKSFLRAKRVSVLLYPPDHPHACQDAELQEIGKSLLMQTVDDKYYEFVEDAETVYEAFENLRLNRHGRIGNHRVRLLFQFHTLVLETNETIRDLVARTKKLLHQLAETGVTIEEEQAAVAILIAVNKDSKYGHQVEHFIGMGMDLTINNVQAALMTCEDVHRMKAPSAFAATPPAAEQPPAAPTADAIAALSKQVQSLSSRIGQQQKQKQQQNRKNGPQRNQQQQQNQQQQRKAPYTRPRENKPQQGVSHDSAGNCLNCGGRHKGLCYKGCIKCGRMNHYANECRAPPQFHAGTSSQSAPAGRANMMSGADQASPFFPTGRAMMAGHVQEPFPDPFLPPLDPMLGVEPFPNDMHFGRFPAPGGRSFRANTRDSKYNWVLDSGASHHMTGVKAYLFNYQPLPTPLHIQAAGQHPLYCVGKGTMRFTSTVAGVTHRRELHNVWYVPDMSISLLSTQALKRAGCQIFSAGKGDLTEYVVDSDDVCFLVCPHPGSDNGLNAPDFSVLMNDAYLIDDAAGSQSAPHAGPSGTSQPAGDGICTFADAVHASDPESPDLWHQRLGHTNYQYLYQLVRNGLVKGITLHPDVFKKKHNQTCEACIMAKHQRAAAGSKDTHAEHPMEILHSDVCVYPTPALFGERYAVTLLDEYAGYAGVGLLLTKDQVEEVLKSAITLWENKSGYKCKIMFSDRGGEYLGNSFQAWLRQKGIKHHMSPPRTPMTNGRAERLNQTLNNAVRTMLLQYNLPKVLWAQALLYAVEIHNRGYNKTLQLTPYQAFLKQVPSVHNFRTFGCKVFARLPETTRDKLDPKSEIGMYLGPSQDGPGHKVLTYQHHLKAKNKYKIHIYRDIVTLERLTDVCGVQAPSALRWGGDIPLPSTQQLPPPAVSGAEEPMTGVLEPTVQPLTLVQLSALLQGQRHAASPVVPALPAPQPAPSHTVARTRASAEGSMRGSMPPRNGQPSMTHADRAQQPQPVGPQHELQPQPAQTGPGTSIIQRVRFVDEADQRTQPANRRVIERFCVDNDQCSALFSVAEFLQAHEDAAALDTPAPGQGGVMDAAAQPRAKKQKISITQTLKNKLVTFEHICLPLKSTAIVPFRDAHNYPLPKSVKEALSGPFAYEWLKALLDELQSLLENGTWELVPRRPGMKVIPCHWVFTIKSDADGNPVRFKCRLVAGGNHQEYGIDYLETFAPVSRQATMKTFLALAARNGWEVHQIDIKTAFLNGPVDTDVFMMQPPGFVEGFNLVCHLLKCLYGLKQAPRQWYEMLKAALRDLGFEPQLCDTSFWVNRRYKCIIYLTSVVDDMLVASAIPAYTLHVIKQILSRFKGTHGGIAHHYCGMKLTWQQGAVKLSQQAYVEKVLSMFTSLTKVNPRTTPMDPDIRIVPEGIAKGTQHFESPLLDVTTYPYRTLIGAMNYLACCTRPDIAYTVNQLAKVNNAPTVAHWKAAIHCLGYLQATKHLGIVLGHSNTVAIAYVDSSYGTGTPDLKPVAGHVVLVHGGPVTWASKTQQLTSTSSTEAEYRALSDSVKDVLWLSQILSCFNLVPRPFPMKSDNMGAIKAAKNHISTKHTKHIELHVQFLRERVQRMEVDITHIPGTDNPADLFTKPLPRCKLEVFRKRMGVQ